MIMPTSSHPRKRTHVMTDRLTIRYTHDNTPSTGMIDPPGTLNGRFASGRLARRTITASDTTTNANSVPMLVISPRIWIGTKPATSATIVQVMIVVMYGVRNFGWTLLTPAGRSWSRLIEKKMRGWLMGKTRGQPG